MATYSSCSITKIKSAGTLASKEKHNRRLVEVDNADPELTDKNETLADTVLKLNGRHMDYNEAVRERISSLPYYENRKPRSDQVLAYEVLLTFTKDDAVDIEKWKMQSVKWLHDYFDKAPDGKTNVLNIEYHGDESGNVHIHALVCPVDPSGHLNARYFTGGYQAMTNIQSSYADYVKDLGIERGIAGSSASHQKIRKMYAKLNNATTIPEVLEGETAEQYRSRTMDELETRFASNYKKANEYYVRKRQEADQYFNDKKAELQEETERERSVQESVKKEIDDNRDLVHNLMKEVDEEQEKIHALRALMCELQREADKLNHKKEDIKRYLDITRGINVIEAEDPETADRIKEIMAYAESLSGDWTALVEPNDEEEEWDL